MPILLYGGTILVGFVLGYFLTTLAIGIVTVCAGIAAVWLRPKSEEGLGALIGVIAWWVRGLAVLVMWGTHLSVTDTELGLDIVSGYIFR